MASLMRSDTMARSKKTDSLYVATSPGMILYGSSSNLVSKSPKPISGFSPTE